MANYEEYKKYLERLSKHNPLRLDRLLEIVHYLPVLKLDNDNLSKAFYNSIGFFQYEKELSEKDKRKILLKAKQNISIIQAKIDEMLDDELSKLEKEETTKLIKLEKSDVLNGFNDYHLTKSKIHVIMCDKSQGAYIGLNKLLDLGKNDEIETIIVNDRGDRKFSVKSTILWARKYDKKIYRVMLKKLNIKEE